MQVALARKVLDTTDTHRGELLAILGFALLGQGRRDQCGGGCELVGGDQRRSQRKPQFGPIIPRLNQAQRRQRLVQSAQANLEPHDDPQRGGLAPGVGNRLATVILIGAWLAVKVGVVNRTHDFQRRREALPIRQILRQFQLGVMPPASCRHLRDQCLSRVELVGRTQRPHQIELHRRTLLLIADLGHQRFSRNHLVGGDQRLHQLALGRRPLAWLVNLRRQHLRVRQLVRGDERPQHLTLRRPACPRVSDLRRHLLRCRNPPPLDEQLGQLALNLRPALGVVDAGREHWRTGQPLLVNQRQPKLGLRPQRGVGELGHQRFRRRQIALQPIDFGQRGSQPLAPIGVGDTHQQRLCLTSHAQPRRVGWQLRQHIQGRPKRFRPGESAQLRHQRQHLGANVSDERRLSGRVQATGQGQQGAVIVQRAPQAGRGRGRSFAPRGPRGLAAAAHD